MLKAVLFDLDGTLLFISNKDQLKVYFSLLTSTMEKHGYMPDELVQLILSGIKKMQMQDGSKTNYEIFWNHVEEYYHENKDNDIPKFDAFYSNEYLGLKDHIKENPYARKIINYLRSQGIKIILATNAVYPKVAILSRISFIGLKEEDFDYISTYNNSHYAKPNPMYYQEILDSLHLSSDEVLFFGNDEYEDGYASYQVGIKSYMIGDYIIKDDKHDIKYPWIPVEKVVETIKQTQIDYNNK